MRLIVLFMRLLTMQGIIFLAALWTMVAVPLGDHYYPTAEPPSSPRLNKVTGSDQGLASYDSVVDLLPSTVGRSLDLRPVVVAFDLDESSPSSVYPPEELDDSARAQDDVVQDPAAKERPQCYDPISPFLLVVIAEPEESIRGRHHSVHAIPYASELEYQEQARRPV